MEIVGMRTQRRKQADILDALDKLSFASVHTPQITVETITLEEKEIDVLVIYNTDQTPVYLKKPYGKMLAGCIYTRTEDRNTPDGGNAEIEQIEYLWRKRFGLTKPALQFIIEHCQLFFRTFFTLTDNLWNDVVLSCLFCIEKELPTYLGSPSQTRISAYTLKSTGYESIYVLYHSSSGRFVLVMVNCLSASPVLFSFVQRSSILKSSNRSPLSSNLGNAPSGALEAR